MRCSDTQGAEDIERTGSITWNYYKIDGVQSKRGCAKNVTCFHQMQFGVQRADGTLPDRLPVTCAGPVVTARLP